MESWVRVNDTRTGTTEDVVCPPAVRIPLGQIFSSFIATRLKSKQGRCWLSFAWKRCSLHVTGEQMHKLGGRGPRSQASQESIHNQEASLSDTQSSAFPVLKSISYFKYYDNDPQSRIKPYLFLIDMPQIGIHPNVNKDTPEPLLCGYVCCKNKDTRANYESKSAFRPSQTVLRIWNNAIEIFSPVLDSLGISSAVSSMKNIKKGEKFLSWNEKVWCRHL